MNILLFTISFEGGAGGAAYRLHRGFQTTNISSKVLIQSESSVDENVVVVPKNPLSKVINTLRPKFDALPLRLYPQREFFALQWVPDGISSRVAEINPDIINLHWVCNGFVRIESLSSFNKPIVWTMHDMWPFTGGCFHSYDCERYTSSCGTCPELHSDHERDLSRWVWKRKAKAWRNIDLTLVSPSAWLAERARKSSLFKGRRVEVIPNGLDISTFRPINRFLAREILKLPSDKHIILFGAWISSHLKGFHLLQPALQKLSETKWRNRLEVVTFGFSKPRNEPDLGFKVHYLGRLNDDVTKVLAYSAADIYVIPSLVENLSTTTIEAFACGIPCVAFNVGGMPEIIDHKQNGYLAQPYDIEDLANGIDWVLDDQNRYQQLALRARKKAEDEYSLEMQVKRYSKLFTQILESQ